LVLEAIQALALMTSKTAGAIYSELKSQDDLTGLKFSLKTVERVVKEIRPPQDTSDVWTLADSDGDDARKILSVLRGAIWFSDRQITHFTKTEADWVLKITKVAPGLDALRVWLLAKLYQRRLTDQRLDTEDLDAFLACMPWMSPAALDLYREEVSSGLKPVPMWDWLVEQKPHYVEDGEIVPGWPRMGQISWPGGIDDTERED
jgi:hypothetical protein